MTATEKKGERIAKVMARVGICSRRDAEKMIIAGRVTVNGTAIDSPALDVTPSDKITLDGKPIDAPQETRLWAYYKPLGLVTSEKDEKGRQTVFDTMPEGMPRVMSVGRLDLNSEGLLLLTNDGGLKRRLELPTTGWLRKYRVRVNGQPNNATFDPLRRGITIDGEDFLPMDITLDRQRGANAWLTVGIREGKNREIRRAMVEVGLIVNRLIRVSYGPFRLNEMKPGDVVEIKRRVLRDQLGALLTGEEPAADRALAGGDADRRDDRGPRKPRGDKARRFRDDRPDRSAKPRAEGDGMPRTPGGAKPRGPEFKGPRGPKKPFGDRPERRSDTHTGKPTRGEGKRFEGSGKPHGRSRPGPGAKPGGPPRGPKPGGPSRGKPRPGGKGR